jgi:oligoribonuclease NrnB/cAMP/cGMP phosphodiesterase (DHH superfamily)
MKCFYHSDLDGRCAGYWVRRLANKEDGYSQEYIQINYNVKFPFDKILSNEIVYIVDFSISPEDMTKLLGITNNVFWIDHHKTAIEKYDEFNTDINGLRYNGLSGAMLTWIYLVTPDGYHDILEIAKEAPLFTKLVSDWDCWVFYYGEMTKHFKTATDSLDLNPNSDLWDKMASTVFVEDMVYNGQTMIKFRDAWAKEYMNNGFIVNIDGYKGYAVNLANCNSEYFSSIDNGDYDILVPFSFNGKNWTISLYSKTIDVSEIAKTRGGGGHKGASGFTFSEFPFIENEGKYILLPGVD